MVRIRKKVKIESSRDEEKKEPTTITDLPDDVIGHILVNFSVKEAGRLKLVLKSWCEIIDTPDFRNAHRIAHRQQSLENPLLLVASQLQQVSQNNRIYFTALEENYWSVVGKNGLSFSIISALHVLKTNMELVCMYYDQDISVCNPTTQEHIVLPRKSSRGTSGYLRKLSAVGFGYIQSSMKYKVVRFSKSSCDVLTIAEDTYRWRIAPDPPFPVASYDLCGGVVYSNGGVHLLSRCYFEIGIARFNLEKETWTVVKPPPVTECWLCDFGGFLCAVTKNTYKMSVVFEEFYLGERVYF